ncbi:MAG: phage tail protein [Myxococcota bacterium]
MTTPILKPELEVAFNFSVTLGDLVALGEFLEVSALVTKFDTEDYHEGGAPYARTLYGPKKQENITLKWGYVSKDAFQIWIDRVKLGTPWRQNVTIYHYARGPVSGAGQPPPIRTYLLRGAWPVRWSTPQLNAQSSEVPMEELELAYDYFTVTFTKPQGPTP